MRTPPPRHDCSGGRCGGASQAAGPPPTETAPVWGGCVWAAAPLSERPSAPTSRGGSPARAAAVGGTGSAGSRLVASSAVSWSAAAAATPARVSAPTSAAAVLSTMGGASALAPATGGSVGAAGSAGCESACAGDAPCCAALVHALSRSTDPNVAAAASGTLDTGACVAHAAGRGMQLVAAPPCGRDVRVGRAAGAALLANGCSGCASGERYWPWKSSVRVRASTRPTPFGTPSRPFARSSAPACACVAVVGGAASERPAPASTAATVGGLGLLRGGRSQILRRRGPRGGRGTTTPSRSTGRPMRGDDEACSQGCCV